MRVEDSTLEMLERSGKQGQIEEEVWVTLDLPFLVFITLGFGAATLLPCAPTQPGFDHIHNS